MNSQFLRFLRLFRVFVVGWHRSIYRVGRQETTVPFVDLAALAVLM